MPRRDPHGLIERPFQLVVLQVPSILERAEGLDRSELCERIERLLDQQVRIAVCGTSDACAIGLCRNLDGLARVFLFVWTAKSELVGFNQWGKPVRLAKGDSGGEAAGARYIIDAIAEPAEIPMEDVLVIAETFDEGTPAGGFLAPGFEGAQLVALTQSRKRQPPGVRRAESGPAVLVALMDSLLWHLA
jgi:hypothetical protein